MEESLEADILRVQAGGPGRTAVISRIINDVVAKRERYGYADRQEALEHLAGFYHRIGNLVDKYRPSQRGFEPYMVSSLRFHRRNDEIEARERSFRLSEILARPEYRDCAWSEADAQVTWDADETPGHGQGHLEDSHRREILAGLSVDARRPASLESACKRILFLALKCGFSLNETQICLLGGITGLGEAHLRSRIEALRSMAESRLRRQEAYIRVRDKLYAGLCYYEGRAKQESDPERRARWDILVERYRARLRRARQRVNAVQAQPTNEEVALVLGLPKGTVDSGLHYLRKNAPILPEAQASGYSAGHGYTVRFRQSRQARGNASPLRRPRAAQPL